MIPVISQEHAHRLVKELKERLAARIGDRLSAVALFGSYAKGLVSEESDIDVAVLVRDLNADDRWTVAQEAAALMIREQVVLSALPMDRAEYDALLSKERALYVDISREGIWL
ncbi:MAG TPA: nucleotidyltransferase domain-containing protein [Myxococcales bacterium]|jgi:predicted nucleotidyltransferase|nr:nucleotidyltransferase domain-containing protein [Myxococcales bacterium]